MSDRQFRLLQEADRTTADLRARIATLEADLAAVRGLLARCLGVFIRMKPTTNLGAEVAALYDEAAEALAPAAPPILVAPTPPSRPTAVPGRRPPR